MNIYGFEMVTGENAINYRNITDDQALAKLDAMGEGSASLEYRNLYIAWRQIGCTPLAAYMKVLDMACGEPGASDQMVAEAEAENDTA